MKKFSTNTIARMGVMLALIIVLELLESSFFNMPQGGSISIASLIFLLAMLIFNFTQSAILFVLWRILMVIIVPPYIVTPLQFLLDYIVSYAGFLAMYPLMKSKKILPVMLSVVLANIWRYAIHVLTGMVYFGEYAEGSPVLQYSLLYNITYMGPTLIAQLILAVILTPTILKWQEKIGSKVNSSK